jgi:hypothetical protein
MMIVVAISPHIEGKMDVYSQDSPEEDVHGRCLEERKMGHIVELDKESNHVDTVEEPAHVVEIEMNHSHGDNLDGKTFSDVEPCFCVVGT